jgi:hypothetical protein
MVPDIPAEDFDIWHFGGKLVKREHGVLIEAGQTRSRKKEYSPAYSESVSKRSSSMSPVGQEFQGGDQRAASVGRCITY